MSLGLIKFKGLAEPANPLLSIGTPSITIRGALLAEMEDPPRIKMSEPEPGAPPLEVMVTPGTLPINRFSGVVMGPCTKSLGPTATTAPERSFLEVDP